LAAGKNQTVSGGRVLHVLDHSWPVISGYSVRSRNLIRAQHELGQALMVVTSPLHEVDDSSSADIIVDGVPHVRTPVSGTLGSLALQRRWPVMRELETVRLLRNRIVDLIDKEAISIIYAHSPALCGLAGLHAARKRGIPFVYEIRAFWEDAAVDQNRVTAKSIRYRLTRGLELHVARHADAVTAIAQPLLEDLRQRGISSEKLFHVPNGVDADRFVPLPRDDSLARQLQVENAVVLGFFGSLYRYEGIAWLIEAVAKLRSQLSCFKLLIIGSGEDETPIRDSVRQHNAGEYVHLLKSVPHDDINRYYSVVDAMVFPRLSVRLTELVTPLKPLEAMSMKKPVLASDVGGHRELLQDGYTGLLFRSGNVADFCAQAQRLLSSASLRKRLGEAGRETIEREKDWKVLALRYLRIYEFALQQRSKNDRLISEPATCRR
jgi:PEP-CTERM/exosortase A-associated glycosyltransferase